MVERHVPSPRSSENSASYNIREITRQIREQASLTPSEFLDTHGKMIRSAFPGTIENAIAEGAIPVMICARNEVLNIGRTLYGLAKQDIRVQPFVIDNNSLDGTGDFAAKLGAEVITEKNPGLMNALRSGFTHFKDMNYNGMLLHTDADTVPVSTWASTLREHAKNTIPDGGEAFGRIIYYDFDGKSHVAKNTLLSAGANVLDTLALLNDNPIARGPNGIIMTDAKGRILDALSTIENPPDINHVTDVTVKHTILAADGKISATNSPRAMVVTSGSRYPRINDIIGRTFAKDLTRRRLYKDWRT